MNQRPRGRLHISAPVTWASIRYTPIARTWLLVAPHMATVCWDADSWVSRRCGGGALRLLPVSQDVGFPKVERDPVIADITKVGYPFHCHVLHGSFEALRRAPWPVFGWLGEAAGRERGPFTPGALIAFGCGLATSCR